VGLSAERREGKKLALDVIKRKHSEVIARITEQDPPPSSFYAFLKLTRKKYFNGYLDSIRVALETGTTPISWATRRSRATPTRATATLSRTS